MVYVLAVLLVLSIGSVRVYLGVHCRATGAGWCLAPWALAAWTALLRSRDVGPG